MKVTLRAFGIAKDIIGGSSQEMEIPANTTIADLKAQLSREYPEFVKLVKFSIAVNESYQEDDFDISAGDELVIIPPVSGG